MTALEASMATGARASLLAALAGMAAGAMAADLPGESARVLAGQTLKGTALVLAELGESPALLKDRVTSPGGTTISGLAVLEERAVRGALIRTVQRAVGRAEKGKEK